MEGGGVDVATRDDSRNISTLIKRRHDRGDVPPDVPSRGHVYERAKRRQRSKGKHGEERTQALLYCGRHRDLFNAYFRVRLEKMLSDEATKGGR